MNKKKILVVNCRRNGLGVVRALKDQYVIAVDHINSPALYSKYIAEKYILPDRVKFETEFVQGLIDIALKHNELIYLIPTNDDYLEIFTRNKLLLEKYFVLVFESDQNILESCVDKQRVVESLKSTSVNFPRHFTKSNLLNNSIYYPVVVKPTNKQDTTLIGKKGMFRIKVCNDSDELSLAISELEKLGSGYVIQELIEGDDSMLYACGIVSFKGELRACFTGRKLRQFPPKTGEGSYAESIDSKELIDLSEEIVRKLNYSGIANIEFKFKNGVFYFIEMNPRSWSFNSLSTYCGVNLPKIAIESFSGKSKSEIVINSKSGKWIFLYEDLIHNVILNNNVALLLFFKQLFNANIHAYFDLNDLNPVIRFYVFDFWNLMKHLIKLKLKKNEN